jgi:putative endonuclease
MEKAFYVYLMTSGRNGTLYVGVTSNLIKRVWEHKEGVVEGFTREYGVKELVWYEMHDSPETAISREKQIKKWNRAWKIRLIEESNPYWRDLYQSITS